jgi:hypothetical protein
MDYQKELTALLKQYTATTEVAERDLSGWPRNTREGQEMAKRNAQNNLPHIRQKYSEALNSSTNYILVHGTNDEFSIFLNKLEQLTTDRFFVNSTLSLYEFLSPRVEQNLSTNREFNVHSLMMLQGEMVTLGKQLDKNYVLEPKLSVVKVPKTHDDLILVIRECVMANSGYSLLLDYLNMVYTDQALKSKHVSNQTIFVLRCLDAAEATDLSTYRSVTVDLGASTDYAEQIQEVLGINKNQNTETVQTLKPKKTKVSKIKEQ